MSLWWTGRKSTFSFPLFSVFKKTYPCLSGKWINSVYSLFFSLVSRHVQKIFLISHSAHYPWRRQKKPQKHFIFGHFNSLLLFESSKWAKGLFSDQKCLKECVHGMCCWAQCHKLSCLLLSRRYPGPVCCVGGWDELLRHEDQPQQRHFPPLSATQQSTGHRLRQVWVENIRIYTEISQSHNHKHTHFSYWVMVYIPKQKQTLPICSRLKYYANAAKAGLPVTAAHRQWKQSNCV